MFYFLYHCQDLTAYISNRQVSYKKKELLTLPEHLSSPLVFCFLLLIFLVFCVVLLSLFAFIVLSCDVRYDFCIERMFGSSLPPVVFRRAHVLFTLFVFIYL